MADANPGPEPEQGPVTQDVQPAQHLEVPAPIADRPGTAGSEASSFISTTSSGNEKWLSPLDKLSHQPEQHAERTDVAGRVIKHMDEHGIDLRSIGASAPPPLYHQANASTTRMPFHGDESFPGSPGPGTPGLYDNQFAGSQRDSQADLLLNNQHKRNSSRAVSFGPSTTFVYQGGDGKRPPPSRRDSFYQPHSWRPRWHPSYRMYIYFIFGMLCAVGHHLFYSSLHGQLAERQTEMLRYGTFLAYAAKAAFSAAVITAFKQRVWVTVRSRFMSISALDAMFAATESWTEMLNFEFLRDAKAAFAVATFAWTTPLIVILTSNTLLVEPRELVQNTTCPAARSLNFSFEEVTDWRSPVQIDGLFEIPVSIWNTTKRYGQTDDDWFDYYTGPSPTFQQTAALGAFLKEVVPRKNAADEVCGDEWNCNYSVNFTAPGYDCKEMASGAGSTVSNYTQETGEAIAPFGTGLLLPEGNFSYYAYTTGGEYSTTQLKNVGVSGIPRINNSDLPSHFGAFRTEPLIWIGYAVQNYPNKTQPNRSDPDWDSAFTPKIFACEHRETEYSATFNYTDGTQTVDIESRKFGAPVINTTYLPGVAANDGTDDNVTATPEEAYVYPNDTARYRKVGAYHSLGYMLRQYLNGTVEVEDTFINPIQNTDAIQTKLLDPRNNYFPYPNLMDLVQGLYEDLILSMLSNPQFVEVVWAARPSEQSGTLIQGGVTDSSGVLTGDGNTTDYLYHCMRYRTANTYQYDLRDLWIVYSVAAAFTFTCITVGAMAICDNGGVTRNTKFSSVVAATRGPALEKIAWMGPLQDRGDVSDDVKKMRLGYGILNDDRMGMAPPPMNIGPDPYLRGVEGDDICSASPAPSPGLKRAFSTEMRCGFGLKGDVDQRHRVGSLFHK